jgi:hypothetical protein
MEHTITAKKKCNKGKTAFFKSKFPITPTKTKRNKIVDRTLIKSLAKRKKFWRETKNYFDSKNH